MKNYQVFWVGIMLAIALTSCGIKAQPSLQQPSPSPKNLQDSQTSEQQKAAQVIRHYYDAINRKGSPLTKVGGINHL